MKQSTSNSLLPHLITILFGCMLNNLALEYIVSSKRNEFADKNSGGLLTFMQFLVVAVLSLPSVISKRENGAQSHLSTETGRRNRFRALFSKFPYHFHKTIIPISEYIKMSVLFCTMSYLNNLAFAFNISQPLHMVFRSSNLMISYLFGYFFWGRNYTRPQLLGVLMITFGAFAATAAEVLSGDTAQAASRLGKSCVECGEGEIQSSATTAKVHPILLAAGTYLAPLVNTTPEKAAFYVTWFLGIVILSTVLVIQTILGAKQDKASKTYGKAPREAMFYFHAFSIVACVFDLPNLIATYHRWSATPGVAVLVPGMHGFLENLSSGPAFDDAKQDAFTSLVYFLVSPVSQLLLIAIENFPIMWFYVSLNLITQFVCLIGVYNLIAMADQLTVNVALTVRKSISLFLSVFIFGNTFTGYHAIGAVLVFGGALLYGIMPSPPVAQKETKQSTACSPPCTGDEICDKCEEKEGLLSKISVITKRSPGSSFSERGSTQKKNGAHSPRLNSSVHSSVHSTSPNEFTTHSDAYQESNFLSSSPKNTRKRHASSDSSSENTILLRQRKTYDPIVVMTGADEPKK